MKLSFNDFLLIVFVTKNAQFPTLLIRAVLQLCYVVLEGIDGLMLASRAKSFFEEIPEPA